MLEKFLISIGLKQPKPEEETVYNQQTTVRPFGENRFIDDDNIGDIRVHSPKDEVEIKALRSFSEIHNLGIAIKDEFIVAMDIRDIPDQQERRRIRTGAAQSAVETRCRERGRQRGEARLPVDDIHHRGRACPVP